MINTRKAAGVSLSIATTHQEFLEFYIVLYSPHSPHRAPGKVPHIIVLDSTMDSTIKYYG